MSKEALLAVALMACGDPQPPIDPVSVLEVSAPPGIDLNDLRWEPADAIAETLVLAPNRYVLSMPARVMVALDHPEACSVTILPDAERTEVELSPWIAVDPDSRYEHVGYGADVAIEITPGCRAAISGRVTWRPLRGVPVRHEQTARNGFVLTGKTASRGDSLPDPLPWGIVPVSPRTAAETLYEARWSGAGRGDVVLHIRVTAAARAGGVPSVPLGQHMLLGGAGWHVVERPTRPPPNPNAGIREIGDDTWFIADARGRWTLRDDSERDLVLRAGDHLSTRLDCGRSECHASAVEGALASPMTDVLARGLEGDLGDEYDPSCVLACHAVGEPGVPDGGFAHVARTLGWGPPRRGRPGGWAALPRSLRRLSGVGCTTCHGPGAIPTPAARWTILRSDVCATCHDAPTRYGHVAAWRASRMSRSDQSPETRVEPCAGCHTTSGYLARIGVRSGELRVDPPADAGSIGISCSACHAPHGDHSGVALLRTPEVPDWLGETPHADRSAVCVSCHSPAQTGAPAASAAALWLGRGGVAADGAPLVGAPVHHEIDGGCVGCHRGGADDVDVERGAGHAFAVDPLSCAPCHEGGVPEDTTDALHGRARAVLGIDATEQTYHATASPLPADPARARAMRNAALVLEDGAAGVHNAPYARRLLELAEAGR